MIDDDSVFEEEVFCKIESHLGDIDNDPRTPQTPRVFPMTQELPSIPMFSKMAKGQIPNMSHTPII